MAKGKGGNTVAAVWDIAEPIAEELGLELQVKALDWGALINNLNCLQEKLVKSFILVINPKSRGYQ